MCNSSSVYFKINNYKMTMMERAVRNCKETIIREASQDHEIMGIYPLLLT